MGLAPLPGARVTRRAAVAATLALASLAASLGTVPGVAAAQGASHLIVIVGAGGEPQYSESFHRSAAAITEAARAQFKLPEANVVYLGEDPARAGARMNGRSTKAGVEAAFGQLGARVRPGDQLWVVLIGHGTVQGETPRFNLPGPDMTAADFARALAPFRQQQVAFVNATSASGDFVRALAAPNRAVVTATKSSLERNDTRFAEHFAAALAAPGADVDKDARVSLLEAFTFARREVGRAYERENKLLTEHAQLDDNGDGVAAAEPGATKADGALASRLALGGGASASTDPRVVALTGERRALEMRVAELRARKASMDSSAYERQLEGLLLELARKSQELRAAEARP
jgi:hypothetical protein